MNTIEALREQLHKAIEEGDQQKILSLSEKLDKLILDRIDQKEFAL